MDRLTIRNSDGTVSQPATTTIEDVFYRLAKYEDTGLKPEEIKDLQCGYRNQYESLTFLLCETGCEVSHVRELLTAEKEDRLVVLPCKVGQTVYKISHYHDCVDNLYETCDLFAYDEGACSRCYKDKLVPHIRAVGFELSMLDQLGDTIFSTHEEAEALIANVADTNAGNKGGSDG